MATPFHFRARRRRKNGIHANSGEGLNCIKRANLCKAFAVNNAWPVPESFPCTTFKLFRFKKR